MVPASGHARGQKNRNLRGGARELIDTLPPQALTRGGQIHVTQVDTMTLILHSQTERYNALGEEACMEAPRDRLEFTPKPRERINAMLTRFGTTRHRANTEGN